MTIIPSWTLSLDKLSTSGIIRDEELENAGVGEARGGGVPKAGSAGPKGAGTPSTGCVLSQSSKFLQNPGMWLQQE